jgi:hypothetical protein
LVLNEISAKVINLKMQLNPKKCEIMIVDFTRKKRQFNFELCGEAVRIVHKVTILGLHFNDRMCWDEHVDVIIKKANQRTFIIRKLYQNGFSQDEAVHAYRTFIRPHLEYCSVVWGPCLNSKLARRIERCQKRVLSAIMRLTVNRDNYTEVLSQLKLGSLENRRDKSLVKFGRGLFISQRFRVFLPPSISHDSKRVLRNRKCIFVEPFIKHNRYKMSTIPKIINLVNLEYVENETVFGWTKSDAMFVEGKPTNFQT